MKALKCVEVAGDTRAQWGGKFGCRYLYKPLSSSWSSSLNGSIFSPRLPRVNEAARCSFQINIHHWMTNTKPYWDSSSYYTFIYLFILEWKHLFFLPVCLEKDFVFGKKKKDEWFSNYTFEISHFCWNVRFVKNSECCLNRDKNIQPCDLKYM